MPPQRKDLPRSDDLDATYRSPSEVTDIVSRWHFLKKGMEHIFTRLEEGLTYTKYMDLYTYVPEMYVALTASRVIYNFCTHNKMVGEASHIHAGPALERQQRGTYAIFDPNFFTLLRLLVTSVFYSLQDRIECS